MINNKDLRQALRNYLFANVDSSQSKFVPENRRSTITKLSAGGLFIVESFLPTSEKKVAIKTIEALGRVQYDVVVKEGRGTEDAEDTAFAIVSAFEPDTDVPGVGTINGAFIHIDRAERFPLIEWGDALIAYPVSMRWRIYASAST